MRTIVQVAVWGGVAHVVAQTRFIAALKRRDPDSALIAYCRSADHASILRGHPGVDRLVPFRRGARTLFRLSRMLRAGPTYDCVQAQRRLNCSGRVNICEIWDELFRLSSAGERACIRLSEPEIESARRRLAPLRRPVVALKAEQAGRPNVRWLPARWERLVAGNPRATFLQIGEAGEARIAGAADCLGIGLRETFALLQAADALVTADPGLAHAAAALDTPAIALFGATSAPVFGHPGQVNLTSDAMCSPCADLLGDSACPFGLECMASLSAERVGAELNQMLSRAPRAPGAADSRPAAV